MMSISEMISVECIKYIFDKSIKVESRYMNDNILCYIIHFPGENKLFIKGTELLNILKNLNGKKVKDINQFKDALMVERL